MTLFQDNQNHAIPKAEVHKIIKRQPWTDSEKEHVKGLFKPDSHGQISGKEIDKVFKELHHKPDHGIQAHHLAKFHDALKVPFHSSMPSKTPMVAPPRLYL